MDCIIKDNFYNKCTGCGACKNACPCDAISMVESYHTFLYPTIDNAKCINCNRCTNVCPVNNYTNNNQLNPPMFAAYGDDNLRYHSSSGGLFTLLASSIIKQHGIVYCVALDDKQQVKHIRVDNIEDLAKGRKSKYVQSDTGLIYRQIKSDLCNNKLVLFTGCPCQVAGLYNFIGHDKDNLYTIDIICHGVPSQKTFDLYLTEKRNDTIKNVDFRTKKYGWRADVLTIEYKNDPPYAFSGLQGDTYEIGFQNNLILRDSCENCKFCAYPRVGDITIGDFWGMQKYMPNDNKGTSLVLINNAHGSFLYDSIITDLVFNQKLNIPHKEITNRLFEFYPHHKNKELFFEHLKTKSYSESIDLAVKEIFDVGIVGIPTVENFGGSLTYVALYNVIKSFNLSCKMIERPLDAPHPPADILHDYYVSPFEDGDLLSNISTKSNLRELNSHFLTFLVGSDQLFHHNLYNNFGKICTLDWVDDYKKKIAYAASFGHSVFTGDEKERAEMSYYMQKFDAFSVRETSGVSLAKEEFNVDATPVLDPVFLCHQETYDNLIKNAQNKYNYPHIASYILDPNNDKSKILDYVEQRMGLSLCIFSEMFYNNNSIKKKWNKDIEIGKIEDRLANIKNCNMMVTDSFHGVCFAIIFKKNFIAIKNSGRGVARFESILNLVGLSDRLISATTDLSTRPDLFENINYDKVYDRLNPEIEKCTEWLHQNISSPVKKSFSTYDAVLKRLSTENAMLKHKISNIEKLLLLDFANENNLISYLRKLNLAKQNIDSLAIIIAAKDTPGMAITAQINSLLHDIGFESDFLNLHWHGYIALSYKNEIVENSCYDKTVKYATKIHNNDLNIISSPLNDGNKAVINVNGKDYSINHRGLNFVVIDTKSGTVLDSVAFDTHEYRFKCFR